MNQKGSALVRTAKTVSFVLSGFLLALGVILIFWSDELSSVLRFFFGVLSVLLGGSKIFGYFTNDLYRIAFQFDLAMGSLVALFGLLMLVKPESAMPLLTNAVVIYVLLDGLIRVQTAVDAYRFGMPFWYLLLACSVLLVLGALSVFLFGDAGHRFLLMGVLLIADAGLYAFVTAYTVRVRVRKTNYPIDGE